MKKYTLSHFTLIELLVAMAVLVIMMGFLFDFVIGAQKVWSGSSNTAEQFQQPTIIFDYLARDLQNAYISDTPEGSAPLYYVAATPNAANYTGTGVSELWLGFMTRTPAASTADAATQKVGCYPVMYHFRRIEDSTNYRPVYKMYRLEMNRNNASPAITPFELLGKDYSNTSNTYNYYVSRFGQLASSTDLNSMPPLAENILDCKIEFLFSTTANWIQNQTTQRPEAIRITISVFDPSKITNYKELKQNAAVLNKTSFEGKLQNTARTFSKTIFLR